MTEGQRGGGAISFGCMVMARSLLSGGNGRRDYRVDLSLQVLASARAIIDVLVTWIIVS